MPSNSKKKQLKRNLVVSACYLAALISRVKSFGKTCQVDTRIKYFWVSYNSLHTPEDDLRESFKSGLIKITHKKTTEGCSTHPQSNLMTLKFSLSNSQFFGKLASLKGNCSLLDSTRLQNSSYVYECENFDLKFVREGRSFSVRRHFPKLILMRNNGKKILGFNCLSSEGFYLLYRDPQNHNNLKFFLRINSFYYSRIDEVGRQLHAGTGSLGPALTATLVLTLVLVGALKAQKYQDFRRVPVIGLGLTALSFLALIPIIYRGRFQETEFSTICNGLWALFPTPLFILVVLNDSTKSRKRMRVEAKVQLYFFGGGLALQIYGVLFNAYFCIWFLFLCCLVVAIENGQSCHNRLNTCLVILINLVLFYFIMTVVTSPAVYKLGMLYLNANNRRVNSIFYFGVIVCAMCLVFAFMAKSVENSESWKTQTQTNDLVEVLNVDVDGLEEVVGQAGEELGAGQALPVLDAGNLRVVVDEGD